MGWKEGQSVGRRVIRCGVPSSMDDDNEDESEKTGDDEMTLLPKGVNMKAIPLSAFDSATGLLTTSNARTRYVSVNYAEHPQPKYGQCGAGNREDNGRKCTFSSFKR